MYKDLYIIFTRRGIEINNYPSIKKYLSQWKEELTPKTKNSKSGDKGRKPGPYKWYEIQDNVAYYAMFDKEKLIYPELSSSIHPAFDDKKYYIDKTCFMITSEKINIKYILALLSSKTLNFIFRLLGSPLGSSGYNLSKIFVEQLPFVFGDSIFEKELIELTDIIINKNTEYAFEKNLFFKKLINDFKILKISNKLNNFQKLDFKDFLKECEKQKVDTSNSTIKMNLENLFNLSSLKLINLENEINSLEIQLNKMVYKLYDLNENEIKLIEENLN